MTLTVNLMKGMNKKRTLSYPSNSHHNNVTYHINRDEIKSMPKIFRFKN